MSKVSIQAASALPEALGPHPPLAPPLTQVAVKRSSGQHTVGRVEAAWPGWVRVEVAQGGARKDVPEGDVCRLLGDLHLN